MAPKASIDVAQLSSELVARLGTLRSLNVESIRAVRREYSKRIAQAAPRDVIAFALRLLDQPGIAFRVVSYELVCHHRAALRSLRARELQQFGRGLNSWESVDTFACYLAGRAWREHQVSDSLVHRWARSDDRWWRRAALVCTVALNTEAQGGRGDTPRTLKLCAM